MITKPMVGAQLAAFVMSGVLVVIGIPVNIIILSLNKKLGTISSVFLTFFIIIIAYVLLAMGAQIGGT